MKKCISYVYLFCIITLSCSKKSDNPQPAATTSSPTTTTPTTSYPPKLDKPASLTDKEFAKAGDGVVQESYPSITTRNGATVNPQTLTLSAGSTPSTESDLGQFFGIKNQSGGINYFGWKTDSVVLVNGYKMSAKKLGIDFTYFFNIDKPGIYWQYNSDSSSWDWGTWATNIYNYNNQVIGFDYDSTAKSFNEVWEIGQISADRMILSVYKDIDHDGKSDVVIMALNAYHLTLPAINGYFDRYSKANDQLTNDWSCRYYYPPNWSSSVEIYEIMWIIFEKGMWRFYDSYGLWLRENDMIYITSATSKSTITITEGYEIRDKGYFLNFKLWSTTDTSNAKNLHQSFDFSRIENYGEYKY